MNQIINNNNKSLIKEYKLPLNNEIFRIKIEMGTETLLIKGMKDDISSIIFYKAEYSLPQILEIFKINENYQNNKDIFNLITNDFMKSSKISLKYELNDLIILINNNIKLKLERNIPEENDVVDDIFNKLSNLEEQINNFSNYGKNLTDTLDKYQSKLENISKK